MGESLVQADAFMLPFRDGSFDVVMADPPYETANPQGKHLRAPGGARATLAETGYITFASRSWWPEAWRILAPDGHLYVFSVIKELAAWFREAPAPPANVIAWVQPNAKGVQNKIRRVIGGRSLCWRPILHWRKGRDISWARATAEQHGDMIEPNYFIEGQVQAAMREALPWPNQLPLRLVTWLLRPHRGARVLDLFSGTGTTREAAMGLGLSSVSVELSPQALQLIARRPRQPPLAPEWA